jgi:flagellar motor switch protein FliN/FliY
MDPSVAFSAMAAKGDIAVVPLLDGDVTRAAVAILVRPWPAVEQPRQASTGQGAGADSVGLRGGIDLLHDVEMDVSAELGRTRMSVRELLSLSPGAVVELDRAAGNPADLLVNGRLIARGEVVVIDENFGIRITEIISA